MCVITERDNNHVYHDYDECPQPKNRNLDLLTGRKIVDKTTTTTTSKMLNVNRMMGTMIGRRQQMQDIKDGKATCVLTGKYTTVRPGTKHVTFHAGAACANNWPAQENLVARLRNRKGSCVMGPYTDADELLDASQDGHRFKLGTDVTREAVQAMLATKGRLYVYMFYPAHVCDDLMWNDTPPVDWMDWDHFVYCVRVGGPPRTMLEDWFYSIRETAGGLPVVTTAAAGGLPAGMSAGMPTGVSVLMDYAMALTTTTTNAVDFRMVALGGLADMPNEGEWNTMVEELDSQRLREAVDASVLEAATLIGPESRAWAMGTPVYATEGTRSMLREAQAACVRFHQEAVAGGAMDEARLRAVATMERALHGIDMAMDIGGMALGGSLTGLLDALSEYGWAMRAAGIPSVEIDRVMTVWRAIETLQTRVLTAARHGGGGYGGGGGVVGPVPLGSDW